MRRMSPTSKLGEISWTDLTVEQAEQIRDFYQAVVGWTPEPLSMGTYSDFVMNANGTNTPIRGVTNNERRRANTNPNIGSHASSHDKHRLGAPIRVSVAMRQEWFCRLTLRKRQGGFPRLRSRVRRQRAG